MMRSAGEQVAIGASNLGNRATRFLENRPGAQAAVSRGQKFVGKGAQAIGTGHRYSQATPGHPEWACRKPGISLGLVPNPSKNPGNLGI
ncbi:hypothetical protein BLJ79_18085 [Arthrobacter sp. UCD-GKA]|nr:hypothetical protein BLJ79_18085 [Arthrobacter sp. UCD-GKA]